jgi:hypothetical protein
VVPFVCGLIRKDDGLFQKGQINGAQGCACFWVTGSARSLAAKPPL